MAIDSRIVLAGRAPDIGAAFSNALLNVQRGQQIGQSAEQAPARNRLLEAQGDQAAGAAEETEQLNRIRSLAVFGGELAGDIQSGNLASIRAKTVQRIGQDLPSQGLPSNDSQELLQLIDNPNIPEQEKLAQISQLAQQANDRAVQFGALKPLAGNGGPKFIGTPSRTQQQIPNPVTGEIETKSFLTGVVQNADGSFSEQTTPVTGDFVSILGETGAQQTTRAVEEAEGVTTAQEGAKVDVKVGTAEKVGRAQEKINFLATTGTLEAGDRNLLKKTSPSRKRNIVKAESFRDALTSGLRSSGVGRQAASFLPIGVWTDQGSFDEIFNSFSEVAAREKLKASGEIRPTDADVQGMKNAMFGVGRSEEANIQLLNDFITEQNDMESRLSQPRQAAPQAQPEQGMTDNGDGTFTLPDGRIVRRTGG